MNSGVTIALVVAACLIPCYFDCSGNPLAPVINWWCGVAFGVAYSFLIFV